MRVEIIKERGICRVTRENDDPRIRGGNHNAAGESRLLYWVKNALNRAGCDLIKKRMWKDGHMVDDCQQYVRTRTLNGEVWAIFNRRFAICGADEDYNATGSVDLALECLNSRPDADQAR